MCSILPFTDEIQDKQGNEAKGSQQIKGKPLDVGFFFQLKESVKASYDPAIVSYKFHSKNKLSQSLESNNEYDHRESDLKDEKQIHLPQVQRDSS